jgi:hypothetical protein
VGFEVISSVFVVLREIYCHLVNEHVRSEFDLCCCLEEGNDRELSLLMCLFVCHHPLSRKMSHTRFCYCCKILIGILWQSVVNLEDDVQAIIWEDKDGQIIL